MPVVCVCMGGQMRVRWHLSVLGIGWFFVPVLLLVDFGLLVVCFMCVVFYLVSFLFVFSKTKIH